VEKHGADWLTPPLVECIKKIRCACCAGSVSPGKTPYPSSFALYREGKLVAGEFGIICGKIYTSYSGFYDEDNAGTVQLILTTRCLQQNGFLFFDLGMPMDYKTDLGAVNIYPEDFVKLFRKEF
jgi:Leu/Phe-tRNA-protein transferase